MYMNGIFYIIYTYCPMISLIWQSTTANDFNSIFLWNIKESFDCILVWSFYFIYWIVFDQTQETQLRIIKWISIEELYQQLLVSDKRLSSFFSANLSSQRLFIERINLLKILSNHKSLCIRSSHRRRRTNVMQISLTDYIETKECFHDRY